MLEVGKIQDLQKIRNSAFPDVDFCPAKLAFTRISGLPITRMELDFMMSVEDAVEINA